LAKPALKRLTHFVNKFLLVCVGERFRKRLSEQFQPLDNITGKLCRPGNDFDVTNKEADAL